MYLKDLNLYNFKNYEDLKLEFSAGINCFLGDNGSGKTNLLDAVFYLSMSKSYFNSIDNQNIRHGEEMFVVQGNFETADKKHHVLCGVQTGQKKTFKLDKKIYERISDHIGKFPVVMIAPNDIALIYEGSEERRKFFDSLISQIDNPYLLDLMQYNHYLKQRNTLLKQFAEHNRIDRDLLAAYDEPILRLGAKIFARRQTFMLEFQPIFQGHYETISQYKEQTQLVYDSDCAVAEFSEVFRQNTNKDLALQRTTLGVHRDDFEFKIDNYSLKKFGSQGQQKSFLIALKLAHFEIVRQNKNLKPILLLDDIFDKLDEKRMSCLMQMVADHTFGQIFVTDARPERTQQIFAQIEGDKKFFNLQNGQIRNE
ncbi:MAG: DNA replication/repair protein RecF [Microscillaceae bacterium]|nr:DNA replication/repair protein RecF [Microscillaceae bacterium]